MSTKPIEPPFKRWRYPPGCPDSDWCSGNNVCHWDCQGDPDAGIDDDPEPFDHQAARWDHERDLRKHGE